MAEEKAPVKLNLEQTVSAITKRFGKGSIAFAGSMESLKIERISSGSVSLDIESGGGIPRGRVVLLYGEYSSGKTLFASKAIKSEQELQMKRASEQEGYKYKFCLYVDAEGSVDTAWMKTLGVNTDLLYLVKPETAEDGLDVALAMLETGEISMVVIDSLASMTPSAESDEDMSKLTMGLGAKVFNKFFRKLQGILNKVSRESNDCGPTVIVVNQTREKIGVLYGNPETIPGGKGQDFAYSIKIKIRRGNQIKVGTGDNAVIIGNEIHFNIPKNKTAPPYRSGVVNFYFDEGGPVSAGNFDNNEEIIRYAAKFNLIEKQGNTYYLPNGDKCVGVGKLVEYLRDQTEVVEILKRSIYQQILWTENA